jgi:hypothetical protein
VVWPVLLWIGGALLAGSAGVAGVAFVAAFWNDIRESVRRWLHNNGLSDSILMDGWVFLEKLVNGMVRIRVWIIRGNRHTTPEVVTERTVSASELKDAQTVNQLNQTGSARTPLLTLMNQR